MISAINITDEYTLTKERTIFTEKQLRIPGLRMFGRHILTNAIHSLPWHYHADAFEFSIPTKGSFVFSTEENSYPFSGGEVFISFPNEVHGTNEIPVTIGDLYWFQLDISDQDHFLFLSPDAARQLISQLKAIPLHVVKTEVKKIVPLIRKVFELSTQKANNQFIASYLQLFLYLLIEYSKKEPSPISADIRNALEYIKNNLTDELSLEHLAEISTLSCSQFKQKFKNQLGISPRHYINAKKIEYAKTLLLSGMSVTETSMLLNFSTSGYFSTVFKKYTLYTPSGFIKDNIYIIK